MTHISTTRCFFNLQKWTKVEPFVQIHLGVISTQSKAVKTMLHIKIQRECILLAAYVTTHVEYTYIYGLHTAVPMIGR